MSGKDRPAGYFDIDRRLMFKNYLFEKPSLMSLNPIHFGVAALLSLSTAVLPSPAMAALTVRGEDLNLVANDGITVGTMSIFLDVSADSAGVTLGGYNPVAIEVLAGSISDADVEVVGAGGGEVFGVDSGPFSFDQGAQTVEDNFGFFGTAPTLDEGSFLLLTLDFEVAAGVLGDFSLGVLDTGADSGLFEFTDGAGINPLEATYLNGTVTVIPEPSSLLGFAIVGLVGTWRRRRS